MEKSKNERFTILKILQIFIEIIDKTSLTSLLKQTKIKIKKSHN